MARRMGVDPGSKTGAAVTIEGTAVVEWAVWSAVKAGYRVRGSLGDAVARDMHAVGERLAWSRIALDSLIVEGLYVAAKHGGRRVNPQSVVPLAEAAGMVMGPLLRLCAAAPLRPRASEWRAAILHLPAGCDADACEEYAINACSRLLVWPDGFPSGLTYAEEGAVAEASCMALWVAPPSSAPRRAPRAFRTARDTSEGPDAS